MKFILAKKQGMTQLFSDSGRVQPATVLSAGPIVVTQVKGEKDGYTAVQVGYESQKDSRLNKPTLGHLKGKAFKTLKEFRLRDASQFSVGDTIDASAFQEGDLIEVSGETRGKGFQGVVKRHGFHGGRRTHGQKHSEREPGSIGGGGRAGGRVIKGMRMAGRMGGTRVSIKGLRILKVDPSTNTIIVSGAVPGHRGSMLEVIARG